MGEREIREKYGGKLAKAINRAIRAEVTGGNEALDRLTHLAGPARHSRWKDKQGKDTPEADAYYRHQRDVLAPMEADVRRRWGLAAEETSRKAGPVKKKTRPAPKPRRRG